MAVDAALPILVVDDYRTMIRIIRNLLGQIGFENVDEASDGSTALAKLRGKKYSLIISDGRMAPMTGYDLLQQVRADSDLKETPFLMVTAQSEDARLGDTIAKPFNAAALKSKIAAILGDRA